MRITRLWGRGLVVALAVVLLGSVVPATSASARATASSWHVASRLARASDGTSISCPSTSTCWAIEAGQLLSSANGGFDWHSQRKLLPAGIAALHALTCPTDSVCYIIASTVTGATQVLVARDGQITAQDVGDGTPWLAISCPGPLHCVATDGTASYTTRNGGAVWKRHALDEILYGGSPGLACTKGTNVCVAVGNDGETPLIERSVDDGATWTPQTAPTTTDGLYTVACPTTQTCYAAGADASDQAAVIITTNGGAHWGFSPTSLFQDHAVRSVSCVSATTCWVAGQQPNDWPFVYHTDDSGENWDFQLLPANALPNSPHLSCPTATRCAAVAGGSGFVTPDGHGWQEQTLAAAVEAPQSVSCPDATRCVAVENNARGTAQALVSTGTGKKWTVHDLSSFYFAGTLVAVDCPSTTVCHALGTKFSAALNHSTSQAYYSKNGGATWFESEVHSPGGVLRQVASASVDVCLAVGETVHGKPKLERTTNGGRGWHAIPPPSSISSLDGVGCSSLAACVVIGHASGEAPVAFTTPDIGDTFEPHAVPYANAANLLFSDLDCSGATCVAAGANAGVGVIMRSSDSGATWKASTVPAAAMSLGTVSCGSATACAAGGLDDSETGGPLVLQSTDSGKTWSLSYLEARKEQPIDVACHATGCVASDYGPAGDPIILAGDF